MADVKSKRCAHQGCTTVPSYGVDDGTKKAEYCPQHATAGMVDVKSKRCGHEFCSKLPSYGVDDGSKKPEYCSQHAKAGMVDVRHKKCGHEGCTKRQAYGFPGSYKAQFCLQHSLEGIAHSTQQSDRRCSRGDGTGAGRDRDGQAEDTDARRPRAATKRKKPVLSATLPGASLNDTDGASSKKRARPIGTSTTPPAVVVKAEGADRLDDMGQQGSSSRSVRPRRTEGIQLRPTPPTRRQAVEGDTAVKTEVSAHP